MRPATTKAEVRLSKTQKNKRDNKQPIGLQHAGNQSEEDKSFTVRMGEKEEEKGRGGVSESKIKQFLFYFIYLFFY